MRKAIAVLAAVVMLGCAGPQVGAQSPAEEHSFTLVWQADTSTDTTFALHRLLSFDSEPTTSSVCGRSPEGYNVWCGGVYHYGGPVDFNFQSFQLPGCSETSLPQTTITNTSTTRRTETETQYFACTDPLNGNNWTVQTITTTYEYKSSCGGRGGRTCWFKFGAAQQVPITGTVTRQ